MAQGHHRGREVRGGCVDQMTLCEFVSCYCTCLVGRGKNAIGGCERGRSIYLSDDDDLTIIDDASACDAHHFDLVILVRFWSHRLRPTMAPPRLEVGHTLGSFRFVGHAMHDRIGCIWFDPILLVPAGIVGLLKVVHRPIYMHCEEKNIHTWSSIQNPTRSTFHQCNQSRCYDAMSSIPSSSALPTCLVYDVT